MSTATDIDETEPAKGSKKPVIIGLFLAVAGAGGGFLAVQSGLFPTGSADAESAVADTVYADSETVDLANVSYVPLDTIVVNIQSQTGPSLLRFTAQLEVAPSYAAEVMNVKPRIVDVLNTYLRAVEIGDLTDPAALVRLRSQMLRRVQVVTGPDRVSDLLIVEFVLN